MTDLTERRAILARYIRNQAALTDAHPHVAGPGSVKLNNVEALLCADALEKTSNHEAEIAALRSQLADATADNLRNHNEKVDQYTRAELLKAQLSAAEAKAQSAEKMVAELAAGVREIAGINNDRYHDCSDYERGYGSGIYFAKMVAKRVLIDAAIKSEEG